MKMKKPAQSGYI